MELFSLENNIPIPSAVARTIEPFKSILYPKEDGPRSKGRPPRKNLPGLTALAYIWFMEDNKSPYIQNYREREREEQVRARLQIVDEWQEDELIKEARKVYRQDSISPEEKALSEMTEGLFSMIDMMKVMRKRVATITNSDDMSDIQIKEGMGIVSKLLEASDKLPGAISGIQKLREEIKKVSSNENKGKKRSPRE